MTTMRAALLMIFLLALPASAEESVRELAQTFRTEKNSLRRIEAARKLGALGARARGIVPILLDGLRDRKPTVAAAAARALGRIGDVSALPHLIRLLDTTPPALQGAREQAAGALGRLGDKRAVPALVRAMFRKPAILNAVDALAAVEQGRAIATIARALRRPKITLRVRCIQVLGRLGLPEAIPQLSRQLKEKDSRLVTAALRAMGRIGGTTGLLPLLRLLRERRATPELTLAALEVVSRFAHDDATMTIVEFASHPLPSVREAVADALGRIGDGRGTRALGRLLRDPSWAVRARAASALAHTGRQSSLPLLARALKDSSRHVRVDAARGLGRSGLPGAGAIMAQAFQTETDPMVRLSLLRGLDQLGHLAAIPAVLPALSDARAAVRAAAARTLGGLGASQSLLHLYRALNDPASQVRYEAARALARLGARIGLALARRHLTRERDPGVKLWLQALLIHNKQDRLDKPAMRRIAVLREALGAGGPLGLVAAQALATTGYRKAFDLLAGRLRTATPAESPGYIAAIGQLGDVRGVYLLRVRLAEAQPGADFLQRLALIRSLGQLANREATPVLSEIVGKRIHRWPPDGWQQTQLRLAALLALSRIDSGTSVDGMLAAWNDGNPRVRRTAADLLVGRGTRIVALLMTRQDQVQPRQKQWIGRILARIP